MNNSKNKHGLVKSLLESVKNVSDNNDKYTGLSDQSLLVPKKLSAFKDTFKNKKQESENIFDRLLSIVDSSEGNNEINPTAKVKKLTNYTKTSAKQTIESSKEIFIDEIRSTFFAGDTSCGSQTLFSNNELSISPTEIDFFDKLKISPESSIGSIIYEDSTDRQLIKMDKELYSIFDSDEDYDFISTRSNPIFTMGWDDIEQKYLISNLKQTEESNIGEFLVEYYNSIEFPDISKVISQSMLLTLHGDGSETQLFNSSTNKFNRTLEKIFNICEGSKDNSPNDVTNQLVDSEMDLEYYFDFNDEEGINFDEEESRFKKVLKFRDCGNFEIPINKNNIKDFSYFVSQQINIDQNVDTTLNNLITESYEKSNKTFPISDFQLSLYTQYIKNLPKSLIHVLFSPKLILPIVVAYRSIYSEVLTIGSLFRQLSKMFFNIIKRIFWLFIKNFWLLSKKDVLLFVKDLGVTIVKNKIIRWKNILSSLINQLINILKTPIDSCESLYNLILTTINGALNSPIKIPIPGVLMGLSDHLPGFSSDRAMLNITQELSDRGIPTGDLYGQENKLISTVKSFVDGFMKEVDDNSFLSVSNKEFIVPTPAGPLIIPPGIVSSAGKFF